MSVIMKQSRLCNNEACYLTTVRAWSSWWPCRCLGATGLGRKLVAQPMVPGCRPGHQNRCRGSFRAFGWLVSPVLTCGPGRRPLRLRCSAGHGVVGEFVPQSRGNSAPVLGVASTLAPWFIKHLLVVLPVLEFRLFLGAELRVGASQCQALSWLVALSSPNNPCQRTR